MLACGAAHAHSGGEVSLHVEEGRSLCDWSSASTTGSKGKQQSRTKDGGVKSSCAFIFFICPEDSGGLRPSVFC